MCRINKDSNMLGTVSRGEDSLPCLPGWDIAAVMAEDSENTRS